jgi:hypothetical protein
MIRSKYKFSGIRQFMKDKPVKFGIKLWVLADTNTGYTSIFFLFGEKRTEITDISKYAVVFNLLPDFCIHG